jgi:ABC-type Na+ efflux pump permease subunit
MVVIYRIDQRQNDYNLILLTTLPEIPLFSPSYLPSRAAATSAPPLNTACRLWSFFCALLYCIFFLTRGLRAALFLGLRLAVMPLFLRIALVKDRGPSEDSSSGSMLETPQG